MESTLNCDSRISLLDLNHQFSFEIDEPTKERLVFAETLIVSCTHYEGKIQGENVEYGDYAEEHQFEDSSWTCTPTSTEAEEPIPEPFEIKDYNIEEAKPDETPEDVYDDFHFFFFPDCKKPPKTENSNASLIIVDDMPLINPKLTEKLFCTCEKGKKGTPFCECVTKLPCKCGAKKRQECVCGKLKEICICDSNTPNVDCTCHKDNRVCTCYPGPPRPVCTCDEIKKPCVCKKEKFPAPICECKFKPTFKSYFAPTVVSLDGGEDHHGPSNHYLPNHAQVYSDTSFSSAVGEGRYDQEDKNLCDYNRLNSAQLSECDYKKLEDVIPEEPCDCQKPEPKKPCVCVKGKDCICKQDMCICGVQKTCVCTSSENTPVCKSDTNSSKTICECPIPRVCTCEAKEIDCNCFPKKPFCTCGDPENCKCKIICECIEPCICDTLPQKPDECICLDKGKQIQAGLVCTCPCKEKDPKVLKKVRAGKSGYRWCHDVDPYHTFFDYAYGRHDLIDFKEQEKKKFKILGLYDEKEYICPIHGKTQLPPFEKKVRKPSLDCCSSVGGLTISVDTLGELCDKFLIQVCSHASKEGAKTGSKLVSIIDLNLHTLEENRTEYITKKSLTKQCKSYMAICDNGYYNKVTRICGDKHVAKRLYHTFERAKNFLLEGANVVLLRYFGIRRFKGTVRTESVLMDGTICESIYVCLGVSQAIVNGKPLFVNKIERHIIEPSGYIHQTLTVLSLRGYIVSHEWSDNNYVLHINPLLNVVPEKDLIEEHAPLREKWREDLQLFSDYLDFKTTRSYQGARYVSENAKLTNTIRDYMQAILLLKPNDVLHFTRHYFDTALSSMDLPKDNYFDITKKHVRYFYYEE